MTWPFVRVGVPLAHCLRKQERWNQQRDKDAVKHVNQYNAGNPSPPSNPVGSAMVDGMGVSQVLLWLPTEVTTAIHATRSGPARRAVLDAVFLVTLFGSRTEKLDATEPLAPP